MPHAWLTITAWVALAVAVASAAAILYDLYGRGHRQAMAIMEAVWPVTALYLGPAAWWAYRRWGRLNSPSFQRESGERPRYGEQSRSPSESVTAVPGAGSATSSGRGWCSRSAGSCWVSRYRPSTSPTSPWPSFWGSCSSTSRSRPCTASVSGTGSSPPSRRTRFSLISFEVGLFGWMAVVQLVVFTHPHLHPDHAAYWLLMQVGMILGFVTAYPINVWLVRHGVKEAM